MSLHLTFRARTRLVLHQFRLIYRKPFNDTQTVP